MLNKELIGNQIKALRIEKGLSQADFGSRVDLSRSAVSQIESGQMYPSIETLDKIVNRYSTNWDRLMGLSTPQVVANPVSMRTLVTTVDASGKDNIVLVPIRAQAGYLLGFQQPEYIESLPSFRVPGLTNGTFRAFEVSGYSMLADRAGFYPGDIVIGEYVENLKEIRDGLVYTIVNSAQEVDNIVLKRCLNYSDKGGVIICKSDNKDPQYPTFPLPVENIKEVWKFKIKLTRQAPEPSGLYERINALEGDMVMVKERLQ